MKRSHLGHVFQAPRGDIYGQRGLLLELRLRLLGGGSDGGGRGTGRTGTRGCGPCCASCADSTTAVRERSRGRRQGQRRRTHVLQRVTPALNVRQQVQPRIALKERQAGTWREQRRLMNKSTESAPVPEIACQADDAQSCQNPSAAW